MRTAFNSRDRLGAVILLYPTHGTLEFSLEFLWRAGREAEIGVVRDALHQIAGKQVSRKFPSLGCREALAQWETVVEVVRILAGTRAEDM